MALNFKGLLQEWHQKQGRDLPKYTTHKIGGPAHKPTFQSSVVVEGGYEFNGQLSYSKRSAENAAAEIAWQSISQLNQSVQRLTAPSPTVILIDLENKADCPFEEFKYTNIDLIFVQSTNSTLYKIVPDQTYLDQHSNVYQLVIDSNKKDAADVLLIMEFTRLLLKGQYQNYILLSQDHVMESAIDCMNQSLIPTHSYQHYYLARDWSQVVTLLDQINLSNV